MIWAPFLGMPFLRWLLRLGRVIPIDGRRRAHGRSSRPCARPATLWPPARSCASSPRGASRAPASCCRSSAASSRSSSGRPVPIMPVCLDHVWGSIFSYQGGKFFWKLPKRLPYHVYVSYRHAACRRPPVPSRFARRFSGCRPSRRSAGPANAGRCIWHFVRMAVAASVSLLLHRFDQRRQAGAQLRQGAGRRQDPRPASAAACSRIDAMVGVVAAPQRRRGPGQHRRRLSRQNVRQPQLLLRAGHRPVVDPAVRHQARPHLEAVRPQGCRSIPAPASS